MSKYSWIELNKHMPFIIICLFVAIGCNSSIPVTFHGKTFNEYLREIGTQDSLKVHKPHPLHVRWQLIGYGDEPTTYIDRKGLMDHQFSLTLTKDEYFTHYTDFSYHYPYQYSGTGITSGFKGSYNYDDSVYLRFSKMKIDSYGIPIRMHEVEYPAEKWYYETITSATKYVLSINEEYLKIIGRRDVLLFKKAPPKKHHRWSKSLALTYPDSSSSLQTIPLPYDSLESGR